MHSLAEACLYVQVTPCKVCAGPLDCDGARFEHDISQNLLALRTECRTCGAGFEVRFDSSEVLPSEWASLQDGRIADPWDSAAPMLNPEDAPSEAIDLGGWLRLYTIMADGSRSAEDRAEGRRKRLVAEGCLDEALKFFEEDNELPPEDAFFNDNTRREFWERPELFTRQHIADLRFSLLRSQG